MNMTPEQISQKLNEQLQTGQFNAAAKLAKRALKQYPGTAHLANVAGTALASAEQGRAALNYFMMAVKFEPNQEEYQNNLVHAYIVVGQHEKAEELGLKLLKKRKEPSKLCHLLAFSAELKGNSDKVVHYATQGLETAKDYRTQLLVMRGDAYVRLQNNDLAEADFLAVLTDEPTHPAATQMLIALYLDTFRADKAEELLVEPLRQNPDNPDLLIAQVDILLAAGKVAEAREILARVRKLAPDFDMGITRLAGIVTPEDRPQLIKDAEEVLKNHVKGTNSWCGLCIALGNLYFAEKNFKLAGRYLTNGNKGLTQLFVHHPEDEDAQFEEILSKTPAGPAILKPVTKGRPKPIFILGQPRSGTTLSEMILTSHPDVISCGELRAVPDACQAIRKNGQFDAQLFEDTFYAALPEHGKTAPAIVDKLPANYRFIGMMLHGLPGAKIINIERDPREVALSMWRQHFVSDWMRFTNDLRHMALSANRYRRYINHWSSEFGDQFLTLNYKDIVGDVESNSRKMAAFCDLEWVPEMMSPQKNTAQVRTASVTQVREGVHKKSIGGWRALEDPMRDFSRNLDKDLWPELDL